MFMCACVYILRQEFKLFKINAVEINMNVLWCEATGDNYISINSDIALVIRFVLLLNTEILKVLQCD